jgi:predicted nucleic acid-binding Zn ribbon protein
MMEASVKSLADMMGAVLKQTGSAAALTPVWGRVVGEVLARHTRPVRWEGSTLVVRCSDTTWKTALEPERPSLVKKLNAALGEGAVSALMFEVG